MAGKEFGATVSEEEYQRFQQRFGGIYGSTKWFINTALKAFNDRAEKETTLAVLVEQAVDDMLVATREGKQV